MQVDRASDRPAWWFTCNAGHAPTPLGGIGSAWNDPWPARHEAHQRLAARVLGDRFVPGEIPPPSGGLYALTVTTMKKRRGWRTADHVTMTDGRATFTCPTCGRCQQVRDSDLLARLQGIAPGSTLSIGTLDR